MLPLVMAGASLAITALGASANAKAATKALESQAVADEASRRASANSMIAQTTSQNAKAEQIERTKEIIAVQGKADAVMRKEKYNETQALAMVMGAASGRTFGSGSLEAIMDKSESDFMWDQMWEATGEQITMAALAKDQVNIYEAGLMGLSTGKEALGASRLASQAGQDSNYAAIQQQFNNTITRAASGALNTYGGSLFDMVGGK
jgi:hypothetical protein